MTDLIFRKITKKDYPSVIDLILAADPYTYIDLFGSKEKAHKIMPFLFENENSIFYKNNFFCCELDEKVIGICSLFFHYIDWDQDVFLEAFLLANETYPKNFKEACNSFKQEYNNFSVGVSICQVSVQIEYKNKGVGTFLLKNILDIYGNAPIQLYVNKENFPAVHLYEKFGFKKVEEREDYAGANQPPLKVQKMVRG